MTQREEQLAWLRALLNAYHAEHDWNDDEDPLATVEMLEAVARLLAELRTEQECVVFGIDHRPVPEFEIGGEG